MTDLEIIRHLTVQIIEARALNGQLQAEVKSITERCDTHRHRGIKYRMLYEELLRRTASPELLAFIDALP